MRLGAYMIVKDEAERLGTALSLAKGLVDVFTVVDTGSTDGTQDILDSWAASDPDFHWTILPWRSFGENLNQALRLAHGRADWHLRMDADFELAYHVDFKDWLGSNPDPAVVAWEVWMEEGGECWRLPLLTRNGANAGYVGKTHEYLQVDGKVRPVEGLIVHHRPEQGPRLEKLRRDVDLLTEDAEQGDDRSMFYLAQSYRFLGEHELAREWYLSRAKAGGFEEERWLAQCWVKRYDLDVDGLIKCHKQRPWRHEPLTWAARIVAERPNDDRLFREPTP